jgi:hypothetical protein
MRAGSAGYPERRCGCILLIRNTGFRMRVGWARGFRPSRYRPETSTSAHRDSGLSTRKNGGAESLYNLCARCTIPDQGVVRLGCQGSEKYSQTHWGSRHALANSSPAISGLQDNPRADSHSKRIGKEPISWSSPARKASLGLTACAVGSSAMHLHRSAICFECDQACWIAGLFRLLLAMRHDTPSIHACTPSADMKSSMRVRRSSPIEDSCPAMPMIWIVAPGSLSTIWVIR